MDQLKLHKAVAYGFNEVNARTRIQCTHSSATSTRSQPLHCIYFRLSIETKKTWETSLYDLERILTTSYTQLLAISVQLAALPQQRP